MYFIELIIKKIINKKKKNDYIPPVLQQESELAIDYDKEYEDCEHIFMPIDSTNEILSCTKCGFLVKKSELKKKNFFES